MIDSASRALRALLEAMPLGAMLLDERGSIVVANLAAREQTGSDLDSGASVFEILGSAEQIDELRRGLRESLGGARPTIVTCLPRNAEGSRPFRVHLRSFLVEKEATALVLLQPLEGDEELERRIEDLGQRLEDVGRVRHEISNPLMGIIGHAELLAHYPELTDKSRNKVETILEMGHRIAEQLDELSRIRKR